MTGTSPAATARLAFALSIGLGAAMYVWFHGLANPQFTSDFDQVWAGARSLWQNKDPYVVVGPGREFGWNWPLYYPLPALVAVAPLGLVSVLVARTLFAAISAALLAWGITRDGWSRWPIFISVSFMVTLELGQWSALFAAAFFLPLLGVFSITKPNLGVVVVAAAERRSTLLAAGAGTAVLLLVSHAIDPSWYGSWWENLRAAPHFRAPVQRPLGFLLLLAALRWRRAEGRWLLALSIIPQPPSFYDQLLLVAVCITSREALIIAASTVILFFYVGFNTPQPDYASWGRLVGNATVWICYFPALAMVLRRPNEGAITGPLAWLENLAHRIRARVRP